MLPKWHVLFGAIFSVIIFSVFHITIFKTTLIFLSSFLIDFDHYLWYVFNKKSLNLKKAYNWFISHSKKFLLLDSEKRKEYKMPNFIFHGLEFWIIIFVLSLYFRLF